MAEVLFERDSTDCCESYPEHWCCACHVYGRESYLNAVDDDVGRLCEWGENGDVQLEPPVGQLRPSEKRSACHTD